MLELKEAYAILELNEGASKEEIEKKYAFLLKKYRSFTRSDDEDTKAEGERKLNEVNEAYRRIEEAELEKIHEKESVGSNSALKKLGIDEKKASNFFYYYKFHLIFGFIAVLFIGSFIYSIVTKVEPDFNMTFMGDFKIGESETLESVIKKTVDTVENPAVEFIIISGKTGTQYETAAIIKATAVTAEGNVDIYILDEDSFKKYARLYAFVSLDNDFKSLNISDEKGVWEETKDGEKHIYGIDVSDSDILKSYRIDDKKVIAAVGVKTVQKDNSFRVLQSLVE